ncbi:MAG: hypothetical protein AAF708_03405 [Deinococcota bacterium]
MKQCIKLGLIKLCLVALSLMVLAACTVTTGPVTQLTCEQSFQLAQDRGVPYVEALGDYTQCLIDRGDTVNASIRNR